MSSTFQRFRDRQLNTAPISVPWPTKENPEFVFEVAKFANEEHLGAEDEAMGLLRKRGFTKPGPDATDDEVKEYNTEYSMAFALKLAAVVRRHVRGWVYSGEGEIPYNPANLDWLYSNMDRLARIQLGSNYFEARVDHDSKKSEPETPASSPS